MDFAAPSEHKIWFGGNDITLQKSNSYAAPYVTAMAGRSVSYTHLQSPSQGNVHHMIMPASNGNWYISTVSSASSGHYNICLLYTSKMTPDYIVVGIGSKTESYKYKSEIISDETALYTNEKKEISGICNQFLNGKTDQKLFCNEMKDRLNDYYGSRYERCV